VDGRVVTICQQHGHTQTHYNIIEQMTIQSSRWMSTAALRRRRRSDDVLALWRNQRQQQRIRVRFVQRPPPPTTAAPVAISTTNMAFSTRRWIAVMVVAFCEATRQRPPMLVQYHCLLMLLKTSDIVVAVCRIDTNFKLSNERTDIHRKRYVYDWIDSVLLYRGAHCRIVNKLY